MRMTKKAADAYKAALVAIFKLISAVMIIVGLVLTLCIVADHTFQLGWGYSWWSLSFCILYVGIAMMIFRTTPGGIAYLKSERGRSTRLPGNHRDDLE